MRTVNVEPSWKNSDEHQALSLGGLKCVVSEELTEGAIGLGSVEYCRSLYKWTACNPYTLFAPWKYAPLWRNTDPVPSIPLFYKPADIPKRFKSSVMDKPPEGEWWATMPVKFTKEWRAYVVDGEVLGVYCYSSFDEKEVPEFPWKIHGNNITAAIDFGLIEDRHFELVEVNDPYAIGRYGSLSEYKIYTDFVVAGWSAMISGSNRINENHKVKRE